MKLNIVLIGSGNVAHHLGMRLKQAGQTILQNYSQNFEKAKGLATALDTTPVPTISALDQNADLYLLCVPDDAIAQVCTQLIVESGIVVHTSGSTPLETLHKFKRFGVFYPLQTFKADTPIKSGRAIPFLIEANSTETTQALLELAKMLSENVHVIHSEERKKIHLAAVMLNNFTNHLMHCIDYYAKKEGIATEILNPLLEETMLKVMHKSAATAQTGPAIRGDEHTIQTHLTMLNKYPEIQHLYAFFSQSIQALNKNPLS